jgi:hypothetical protein
MGEAGYRAADGTMSKCSFHKAPPRGCPQLWAKCLMYTAHCRNTWGPALLSMQGALRDAMLDAFLYEHHRMYLPHLDGSVIPGGL